MLGVSRMRVLQNEKPRDRGSRGRLGQPCRRLGRATGFARSGQCAVGTSSRGLPKGKTPWAAPDAAGRAGCGPGTDHPLTTMVSGLAGMMTAVGHVEPVTNCQRTLCSLGAIAGPDKSRQWGGRFATRAGRRDAHWALPNRCVTCSVAGPCPARPARQCPWWRRFRARGVGPQRRGGF